MSRKNSSIVSYPDSDDDNDPLHYIKKSRSRHDNAQHTQGYKNRTGKNPGYTRDSRMDGRSRDPRLQPRENNSRDPRLQPRNSDPRDHRMTFRNAESGDPRLQGKPEKDDHYEPMYNRKGRDFEREHEHVAHSNSYESAGARWKQYKTEKAAEISKADRFKSAESGWKKLKSENKWDTSNWTNQSESSDDDDGDIYNRKAPKSKIDLFSNTPDVEGDNTDDKPPTEKDFWWKYKDDDPIPNNATPENVTVPADDLFDEILSGNLADNSKDPEKTDDITDDFLYEDVLQQSRKVLEEGKAFLGESVPQSHDQNTLSRISDSRYENSAPSHDSLRSNNGLPAQIRTDASYQFLSHTESQETKQNRIDDSYQYLSRQESQETKQNRNDGNYPYVSRRESQETKQNRNDNNYPYLSRQESQETKQLYQTEPDGLEDNGETWARSITVEKKEDSNWSDESLSPIRRDEPSPDRDVQVNLVRKRSPGRTRERSPSRSRSRSRSRSPSEKKRKDKESYSSLSPSRQKPPSEPQPVQPVITNPYDNPKLNVDNIDRYFDDLMDWNYSHRCLICDKTFENLTKWTEHILDTKHGREFHLDPYRCPPCHDMFRNKQEWKMHMIYAHSHGFMGSINVPKPCTVLPPSPAFPVQHGWRCKSCYIISQTDEDAFRHIKYVHLIHTAQYPCPLCGEPFWHQRDLDRHADDVHAPPKYQCDICQRAFESGEKLQTHRLIKHSKKITCYKCDKQVDELIFKEHCEMHKLEMLKCDLCRDVFKDKYHLEKHMRYDHKKYRHHHRSSSRSPDRRSSRRRSRRSSSRSRRSSSRSRRSSPRPRKVSSRDDHDRRDEKPRREDPSAGEKSTEQSMNIDHRARSQEDSSIPSSNCATPTRDEDEDIYPPGDESYRQVIVKNNSDIIEASLVNDKNSRQDREYLSPRGRRDSRESRHRSRSKERRRSRSRSYDRRSRSPRRERSRSRDRYSSRRHGSYRRSRSRSRSRSYSRDRRNSRKRSTSARDDRVLDQADDKGKRERKFVEEPSNLNNISSNTEESYADDSKENADDEETEWERRISMKMIVKDEVWDKEDDVKPDEVSQPEAPKDLPIFDIPKEDDDRGKPEGKGNVVENATWVVEEKPSDENKDSKEESDNEEEKKQFVCKECGKALGSLMQLRDHFTVKHKKGYNLRNKRPATDIKKSQPVAEKEPKLSEEQKEIAKLIEGIE